jgi:hypothetical protein
MVWLGGLCARASLTVTAPDARLGRLAGPFQGIARAGKLDDVRLLRLSRWEHSLE